MNSNNNEIPYRSIPFTEYYKKVKGAHIEISFINQRLLIQDREKHHVSSILFSKSIKTNFTIEDLLQSESLKKEKVLYYVYENGFDKQNWLWCLEVISIDSLF
jgi:hypothetical protein